MSKPNRHEQFVRDLNKVSAATADTPPTSSRLIEKNLTELASRFEEIRSQIRTELGGPNWLSKLPAYDPLLSPVGYFGTLDLGLRETAHTRMLGWLMDPNGDHEFGDTLLRVFLQEVFSPLSIPKLSVESIDCETVNSETRDRLDICMRGTWLRPDGKIEKWLVIVEAKIDADEGEDQCARYEKQCHAKIAASDRPAFVFLTPKEDMKPKTGSTDSWKPLSFIRLMALFRTQLSNLTDKHGFHVLRHYMTGVLKDIYRLNCGRINANDDLFHVSKYLSLREAGAK